jgi:MFS family permease
MALGGLLAGILYDISGSYRLSFAISVIGGVGASIIAMTLQPPTRSLKAKPGEIRHDTTPA